MSNKIKHQVVDEIIAGFDGYMDSFNAMSKMAPQHFRERNWDAMQNTHRKRLMLYKDWIKQIVGNCHKILLEDDIDQSLWPELKSLFSEKIKDKTDKELAETFFNSVVRKVVPHLAVDEQLMFVYENYNSCAIYPQADLFHDYPPQRDLDPLFRKMLEDFDFGVPYSQKEKCIQSLIKGVKEVILSRYSPTTETTLQVLKPVFYRNKAAYLIGRTFIGNKWMPFIIPFLNGPKGVFVDTLILTRTL